jgi:hypothetical protein
MDTESSMQGDHTDKTPEKLCDQICPDVFYSRDLLFASQFFLTDGYLSSSQLSVWPSLVFFSNRIYTNTQVRVEGFKNDMLMLIQT